MIARRANLADLAHLVDLERASAFHPWDESALRRALLQRHTSVWRLGPSAYCIKRLVLDEAELFSIGVPPVARRTGLARELLSQVVKDWVERGARSAYLEVREANHPARGLYTTTGWIEMSRRLNYYGPDKHGICMRLSL